MRLILLLLALALSSCSPLYVLRAGLEEARILSRRRPIPEVVADSQTAVETRRKLGLVLQARSFAEKELRLNTGKSFTTYSWVDSDTLLMVLSAVRKDRFEPRTWWFPIVGHVPYKGYFDFDAAYAAAAQLDRQGYDTHVRPSGAFSTLGWFNDPVLNTVLRYSDVSLGSTVIHELLHNTIFVPSQVAFNESFANFVGDRGAVQFFCQRDGPEARNCTLAEGAWQDNLVFGEYLTQLIATLEELYGRPGLTSAQRIALREDVFRAERARFASSVAPRLRTNSFRGFERDPLNNATLIGTWLYYDRLHLFEAAYQKHGRDLKATMDAVIGLARARKEDPYAALAEYVK